MGTRPTTTDRREQLYRDAIRVICTDYAGPLTVDDVSHQIATSRRQLQRVLAEVGGTTFGQLLARARMAAAERLLHDPDIPVKEVARRVGYRQPAQFAKSFRLRYGATPREYRRAKANDGGRTNAPVSRTYASTTRTYTYPSRGNGSGTGSQELAAQR